MKIFFLFLVLTTITNAAVTSGNISGCPEKGEVIAKEGDQFVHVRLNGKEWKLASASGEVFSLEARKEVTFRTLNNDPMKGEPTLEFQMPSVVMSSLPRLVISYSGVQNKCRVDLHVDKK